MLWNTCRIPDNLMPWNHLLSIFAENGRWWQLRRLASEHVGGSNTALVGLSRNVILDEKEPIAIFVADVTHPSTGGDSSSSIAAVVASMDWPQVTKYRALVSAQTCREEMIKDLFTVTQNDRGITVGGSMIKDGVREGQFNHALLREADAIKKACLSIEKGYMSRITFVVVQRGHHTRFFPENNVQSIDTSGNILPGTVVDKEITHPTKFDLFLCSHAGTKDTSRPAHYHVLWDENEFTADGLQTLTNNLCYTYARCTRSVSTDPELEGVFEEVPVPHEFGIDDEVDPDPALLDD